MLCYAVLAVLAYSGDSSSCLLASALSPGGYCLNSMALRSINSVTCMACPNTHGVGTAYCSGRMFRDMICPKPV